MNGPKFPAFRKNRPTSETNSSMRNFAAVTIVWMNPTFCRPARLMRVGMHTPTMASTA